MKRFCYTSLAFGVLLFFIMIGLDATISRQLHKNKDRLYDSWDYIFHDTISNDLVINGSSRAWVQYNPQILDSLLHVNSYNLGIDGSCINRQIIKYNTYCRFHGHPNFLIQNIDIFSLGVTRGYEREQFFPYFYDEIFLESIDRYEQFSVFEKHIPFYRYLGSNPMQRFNTRNQTWTYKGYCGMERRWDSSLFSKVDTIYATLDTNIYKEFFAFLEEQYALGTKVIFVYAPMYHGVTERCVNMDEMYDTYEQLAQVFDIPILNYNEAAICYDTTYFYNATHLNKVGAEVFSEQLAHDIDSLGILRK